MEHNENIINFLTSNYNIKENDIEIKFNNDEFIVNILPSVIVLGLKNSSVDSLTGGLFKFGTIHDLAITDCDQLVDLYGLQDANIKGSIRILRCDKLKNLIGLPEQFEGPNSNITITDCENFESLEGCPIKVSSCFTYGGCPKLKNLKYIPKFRHNEHGYIILFNNKSLNNLQGIDKNFCGDIYIYK